MAHFYASIQGNRGEATRMGTKKSGINGHIRGWISGASVSCFVNSEGLDVVEVRLTNGSGYEQHVARGLVARTVNGKLTYLAKKKNLK